MIGGAAGAAGGAAAAVAAAAARRRQAEEERMTTYGAGDLEGWEFKILRTAGRTFRESHSLRAILDEEAQAGWELVEKFDDHRIRLKRRTDWRDKDAHLHFDPYRNWVGLSSNRLAMWVALGTVVALVALAVVATIAGS